MEPDVENWEGVSPLGKIIFWIFYITVTTSLLVACIYMWIRGMNGMG